VEALDEPRRVLELVVFFPAPGRASAHFRDAFAEASRRLASDGPLGAMEKILAPK